MKDIVYLSYYQAMIFMCRIDDLKKDNADFQDSIASNFEQYMLKRTGDIVMFYPQFMLHLIPHAKQYALERYNYDYLCNLTNTLPLDRKCLKEYIPIIKKLEEANEKFYGPKEYKR